MNLFSRPKAQKPQTPPGIDEAQARVSASQRTRALRGRAATMLTEGRSAPTARRQTTGN